ncbi:MAG: triose-phosphate isomerase [Myxococcales bacterium]|jgi:triosephosphate isomerase
MKPTPLIAGNWKMNKTVAEALALVRELRGMVSMVRDQVEVAVAPPFTALHPVAKAIEGSNIKLAAQSSYWEASGAFTGEVSPVMLEEVGCAYVIIGHSERRQYFGETDQTVNRRAKAVLAHGMRPIVCVGETLAERESGQTLQVIERQVRQGLSGLSKQDGEKLVIAYEPVWAIGTGKVATTAQAQEVHAFIRKLLNELFGADVGGEIRIQYGGSVKPDNAADLLAQPDINGALVGGASLKAEDFAKIVKAGKP